MFLLNWFRKFINPINHFDKLSDEVILNIFSYLDIKTLFLICSASKRMNKIGNDNILLFSIFSQHCKQNDLLYDENYNNEISYKKLIKKLPDETLLMKLQNAANYFNIKIKLKLDPASQQSFFLNLFCKLAHHASTESISLINSALIGAMLFEINFIASQHPFFFDVKHSITASAIDYQLFKIFKKNYNEIEQLKYLIAFKEYLNKIDAPLFENTVEKEAFSQKLNMVIELKTRGKYDIPKPTRA